MCCGLGKIEDIGERKYDVEADVVVSWEGRVSSGLVGKDSFLQYKKIVPIGVPLKLPRQHKHNTLVCINGDSV